MARQAGPDVVNASAKIADLERKLLRAEAVNENLRGQLKRSGMTTDERIEELEGQLQSALSSLDSTSFMRNLETELNEAEDRMSRFNAILESVKAKGKRNENMEETLLNLVSRCKDLTEKVRKSQSQSTKLEQQMKRAKELETQLKEANTRMTQLNQQLQDAASRSAMLQEELRGKEDELDRTKEMSRELDDANARLRSLERELDATHGRLKSVEKGLLAALKRANKQPMILERTRIVFNPGSGARISKAAFNLPTQMGTKGNVKTIEVEDQRAATWKQEKAKAEARMRQLESANREYAAEVHRLKLSLKRVQGNLGSLTRASQGRINPTSSGRQSRVTGRATQSRLRI